MCETAVKKTPSTEFCVSLSFYSLEHALDNLAGIVLAADIMLTSSPLTDNTASFNSGVHLLKIAFEVAEKLRDFVGEQHQVAPGC
ncbi:hypothetical protein FACS1894185_2970 [Betaproteobacteria bacterium]|nr:hypothetical protein FACS1894185_2970 [Betaproteobacteria bacterium]